MSDPENIGPARSGTELVERKRRGSTPSPPLEVLDELPQIDHYAIIRKLAEGGTAKIFIARRQGEDRICVVKTLHEHYLENLVVTKRLEREAQLASLLAHPNIARITDAKRITDTFYVAMEFIAGEEIEAMSFKLWEQQKMLPPGLSISVTLDVLDAIHYAHELRGPDGADLKIVHRDLSPRNVMIEYTGAVKVIDFGLARTTLGEYRTLPGMVLGTLRYMSPEQAVASPVDRRSDIYTWSVVLYEMLSGRPLILGGTPSEILHQVVTQIPPPLSTINSSLPKTLDAVLEKGFAKDVRDRFTTAQEFRAALIDATREMQLPIPQQIGEFVAELFPEEAQRKRALLESVSEETQVREAYQATRTQSSLMRSEPRPRPSAIEMPIHAQPGAATIPDHGAPPAALGARPRTTAFLSISIAVAIALLALALVLLQRRGQPHATTEPIFEGQRPTVQARALKQEPAPPAEEPKLRAPTDRALPQRPRPSQPSIPTRSASPVTHTQPDDRPHAAIRALIARAAADDAKAFDEARTELKNAFERAAPPSDSKMKAKVDSCKTELTSDTASLAKLEECLIRLEKLEEKSKP
jgi:serine/threonine-protein kinase